MIEREALEVAWTNLNWSSDKSRNALRGSTEDSNHEVVVEGEPGSWCKIEVFDDTGSYARFQAENLEDAIANFHQLITQTAPLVPVVDEREALSDD